MEDKKVVREYQFDNMKALLIFLVVLGHILHDFGMDQPLGDALYKIIFSFHMPAFLFVSGYFARYRPKALFTRLFPLYLIFQCLHYLMDFIGNSVLEGQLTTVPLQFFTPRFTLWYLLAVLAYQLLIPVIEVEGTREKVKLLAAAVGFGLLMGLTPDNDNFMAMTRIVTFLPFFLLGYYERRIRFFERMKKRHGKVQKAATGGFLAAILILIGVFHEQINDKWFLGTKSYGEGGGTWYIRLAIYAVAFLWIWILRTWIPERRLPFVEKIGKNTLPVYLIHGLIVHSFEFIPIYLILRDNVALILLLAVILTVMLSRDPLERMMRRIHISL